VSDVSHASRRRACLYLRRGTFRKRKDRGSCGAGKAPIDPCANIFRSLKDTPPLGRQYFRVWLGHQFVIKSSPLSHRRYPRWDRGWTLCHYFVPRGARTQYLILPLKHGAGDRGGSDVTGVPGRNPPALTWCDE